MAEEKKGSTLVESTCVCTCSDMAQPVRNILKISEPGDLSLKRGEILTLLPERHCAAHRNQKCHMIHEKRLA